MGIQSLPSIAVVTRPTRMVGLKGRWSTANAASFRLEAAAEHEVERRAKRKRAAGVELDEDCLLQLAEEVDEFASHGEYLREDQTYQSALHDLLHEIDLGFPLLTVDREYLPNFDFGRCIAVVVIGPNGLVANTAKYAGPVPIIGVNPDPDREDDILVPFRVRDARAILQRTLKERADSRSVTLAEAVTNDGQRMLAFNDFFVGCRSHTSARYTLEAAGTQEHQSSSGVLVSTGAGSTGWLSSLFNMANGFNRLFATTSLPQCEMSWEERRLVWAVREPFRSLHSGADLVMGWVENNEELVIASQMPHEGVIFSDGIESDFLEFTSGTIATFSVSKQTATLVVGR